ncbi:MAG: glycosyltransferase family 4 protein [bacterium]|nr:glycosyltransferase family 4 protein [bacterium]
MKILIATGIYPPDIGGPAQYARGVEEAWKKEGHRVKVLAFRFERKLPTGIRHLYYFFRVLFSLRGVDFVFSPDTFSAAIPALLASKLFGKKIIIRTGGDFLWEQYVERTGDLVLLKDFYETRISKFNRKERTIFSLLRFLFQHSDGVIFSTAWQKDIFEKPYALDMRRCFVVENFYGPREYPNKLENVGVSKKVFVGGTRELKWKNMPRVKEAFTEVQKKGLPVSLKWETGSRGQFLLDIQSSYAVILASLGDVSPNTILEAIQFGKPFILTREAGFYEKLQDIGVWVDPEDVNDITAKIEWLADEKNYEAQCKKIAAFTFTHTYEQIASEILVISRSPHNS